MDKEFLMLLYERIDRELDELQEKIYREKYEPACDLYWQGVGDGVDNARKVVEGALREVSSGRV